MKNVIPPPAEMAAVATGLKVVHDALLKAGFESGESIMLIATIIGQAVAAEFASEG